MMPQIVCSLKPFYHPLELVFVSKTVVIPQLVLLFSVECFLYSLLYRLDCGREIYRPEPIEIVLRMYWFIVSPTTYTTNFECFYSLLFYSVFCEIECFIKLPFDDSTTYNMQRKFSLFALDYYFVNPSK